MASVSTFTLTFVLEVKGLDIWHDCTEGWLDLGAPTGGTKLSYNLYPGTTYELDVLIWPHVAKIWCRGSCGWVRTWLQQERRWLAFSVRHSISINSHTLRDHVLSVVINDGIAALSQQAKNDKNAEVHCPKPSKLELLQFSEVRADAAVTDNMAEFMKSSIWAWVEDHLPFSHLDGSFDVPQKVTDVRHQNAVLEEVEAAIVKSHRPLRPSTSIQKIKRKSSKEIKPPRQAKSPAFEIRFNGDAIFAGITKVRAGKQCGERGEQLGVVAALLSTCNLPPPTQPPVFFVHAVEIEDLPQQTLLTLGFSQVYTRWQILGEEHSSPPRPLASPVSSNDTLSLPTGDQCSVVIEDPRALILERSRAAHLLASFQEDLLEVEIRAIREPVPSINRPCFFGSSLDDSSLGRKAVPRKPLIKETDVLIAVCRVDLQDLVHGNGIIQGSFPVLPPPLQLFNVVEKPACTNEINAIRSPISPASEIPAAAILEAAPTLTLSVGFIGCRPPCLDLTFGRLLCSPTDMAVTAGILEDIFHTNEEAKRAQLPEQQLTGWVVDQGASSIIYVEGPSDGRIMSVWARSLQYETSNASFSTAARYPNRLYGELLESASPFLVVKLHAPPSALLACPPVYVRPALPLPARAALLKLGQLCAVGAAEQWRGRFLPTTPELRSLCLELAAPRRPTADVH